MTGGHISAQQLELNVWRTLFLCIRSARHPISSLTADTNIWIVGLALKLSKFGECFSSCEHPRLMPWCLLAHVVGWFIFSLFSLLFLCFQPCRPQTGHGPHSLSSKSSFFLSKSWPCLYSSSLLIIQPSENRRWLLLQPCAVGTGLGSSAVLSLLAVTHGVGLFL